MVQKVNCDCDYSRGAENKRSIDLRIKAKRNSENNLLVERPVAHTFLALDNPDHAAGAAALALHLRIFDESVPFLLDVLNILAAQLLPSREVCPIHQVVLVAECR